VLRRGPALSPTSVPTPEESFRVVPGPPLRDNQLPRAGIVILNLDGRHHLKELFESLAAVDYPKDRFEVFLVDNGSTDGSIEEMRANFGWVRLIQNERNLGFSVGCNQGAREARDCEVLVFLNNDMRVDRGWLRELVSPIVRGECQATTGKMLSWDGKRVNSAGGGMNYVGIGIQYGYDEELDPRYDVPRKTLFACGGSMAIDPKVYRETGGFDEEYFAYYEDVDLGWRMWVQGHECRYVPTSVCWHHHSSTSSRLPRARVRVLQARNPVLSCVKNYDDLNLSRLLGPIFGLALRRIWLNSGLENVEPFRIEKAPKALGPGAGMLMELTRWKEHERVRLRRSAAADLIGLNDLLGNWDHWMKRRAEVQAKRRRKDEEIFPLFLKPRWCIETDETYQTLSKRLCELLRLDEVFPPDSIPEPRK